MASGEVATNGGAGVKIGGTVSEPVRQSVRRQIAQGERWRGAEDRNAAANPSGGLTCYGTDETIPYCNGRDCPEWGDCHGDRLRGFSDLRGARA